MILVDERLVHAGLERVFALGADVERWPEHLAHYRWVRTLHRTATHDVVEMAAWRPVGPQRWPTWWVSEMVVDHAARTVHYRHVRGITRGMDVEWSFTPHAEGTVARITHVWDGPAWPLIGAFAATAVIGPLFVHATAQRTLAGLARVAEAAGP